MPVHGGGEIGAEVFEQMASYLMDIPLKDD
jgi:hypothetical protein